MVVSTAMAGPPVLLEWGTIETSGAEPQAMFRRLKASASAPVAQRPTAEGAAPWLVQFNGAGREEWKTALEAAGAAIREYIPENAFLVEATPRAMARVAALPEVAWAGEYLPAFKTSKAARELSRQGSGQEREYSVKLFRPEYKPGIVRDLGEMGAFVSRAEDLSDPALFRAWLSAEEVGEVASRGEVEWIEPYLAPRSWGAGGDEEPSGTPDDQGGALRPALGEGAGIHLVRRGLADAGSYGVGSRAIDRFVWEHPEMLVVVAAGNAAVDLNPADGVADAGSVGSPATAKNALSVGASEGRRDVARTWRDSWPEDFAVEPIALDRMAQVDGPQGMAAFSGRGPCADGRIKPDLVAPGTFVVVPHSPQVADKAWGVAADTHSLFVGGTGVAAEQVADAARQARQWLVGERGLLNPSAALVKALLINGARDLAPGQYGRGRQQEIPDVRPNPVQGFGQVDGFLALSAGPDLDLHDGNSLAAGETDVFELKVEKGGESRFVLTMAYSDYPAASAAGRKRVNDLDLTVRKPSGSLLHANGRTSPDAENNVEMIEFAADEAGAYVARVEARNVPMGGKQPYALVIREGRAESTDSPAAAGDAAKGP